MFIQTRFVEQHEVEKRKRNSAKNQIPPASQASPGPGPWLTNIIDECVGLDEANLTEEQQSALEIRKAYLLRPRYRTLKYPLGPHACPNDWLDPDNLRPDPPAKIFIVDEVETLETRSFCFGVGVREPEDTSARFKFMDQDYCLSGRHEEYNPKKGQWNLQEWLRTNQSLVSLSNALEVETTAPDVEVGAEALYVWTADGDEDLRDVLVDVSEVEEQVEADEEEDDEEEQPAPVPVSSSSHIILTKVPVSDEELRAHYARWYEDPSAHEQVFGEKLAQFIYVKVREMWDGDDLRKRNEVDDLSQEFLLEMMETLVERRKAVKAGELKRNGKPVEAIRNIAHFVTRSWTNAKKKEYKVIAEFDELHPSEQARGTDSDGEDTTVSLLDKACSQSWSRGHHSNVGVVVQETEAEFLVRCMAKRETLPEDLRDISDLWVAGHAAQNVADALGLSRQQVERRKTKIKKAMQNRKVA